MSGMPGSRRTWSTDLTARGWPDSRRSVTVRTVGGSASSLDRGPMRTPTLLVFACMAAVAAGCGGDDGERAQRTPAPVALDVTSPADDSLVREQTVEVRGTVEPAGAAVRVMGRAAEVSDGAWS